MKNRNCQIGAWGEEVARKYLETKGYRHIVSNVKLSFFELDLIMEFEEKIIFVEVKTRLGKKFGSAEDMVGRAKIDKIKKGAAIFLGGYRGCYKDVRFDFLALDVKVSDRAVKIKHYKDVV